MALTGTLDHPKILHLAELLDVPSWAALGMAEALWLWTAQYARHGAIGRHRDITIANGVKWGGKPSELIGHLVDSGLVDRRDDDPENRLVVHDWADYCPNYVRKRMERANECFWDGKPVRDTQLSGSREPEEPKTGTEPPQNGNHAGTEREPQPPDTGTTREPKTRKRDATHARKPIPSHPIKNNPEEIDNQDLLGRKPPPESRKSELTGEGRGGESPPGQTNGKAIADALLRQTSDNIIIEVGPISPAEFAKRQVEAKKQAIEADMAEATRRGITLRQLEGERVTATKEQ